MKSYFLDGLADDAQLRAELSARLPRWREPWLLKDGDGDVIAYFNIQRTGPAGATIQSDLSGRHVDRADHVVAILRELQAELGGRVTDDDDRVL